MLFKTARIETEFANLAHQNPKLAEILFATEQYSKVEFDKEPVITCIYRSPDENKALYAPNPQPDWKPHTLWMACDLRSLIYTPEQITKLLSFLNHYTVFGGQRKCAVFHQIQGNVYHMHLQSDKGQEFLHLNFKSDRGPE